MAVSKDKTRIIITIPSELKMRLDNQALKEQKTVTSLVSSLIQNYLTQIDMLERQQYFDYLATSYLSNPIFYNQVLQEMNSRNLLPINLTPVQIPIMVKNFLIYNYPNVLNDYAQTIDMSFEKYINMRNQYQYTNNQYINANFSNPYIPPNNY